MRYAAFISYRHSELDMEIAKKVHTGLETYHIPASVQRKTGKKKVGRVFRDQEELPIGSDLDDNISAALESSEYLIVICSPRTPESYWVCKEIETFIQMHDRNHVLAVLIEGEPDESFPPQLLTDENGNPVEPLAADVRGEDRKERNTKFKTEILRLAAPVIGCTYDDLRQRDRERRIRRLVTIISSIAAVVAVAGTAFGIYNANIAKRMTQLANEKAALADEKTRLADEITVQYQGKQENQSRFYAEEALSLLKSGNREDAVLVAMEALPSEGNDRPYVAEAEYALSQALYAYDYGNNMTFDKNLTHSLSLTYMNKTDDASKLVTIDSGSRVYVWSIEDRELLVRIDPAVNESNYYVNVKSADADSTGIYVATEKELTKYDYDGSVIYTIQSEDTIKQCDACDNDGRVVLVCRDSISMVDAGSGKVTSVSENQTGYSYTDKGRYYKDNGIFAVGHYDSETTHTVLTLYDTKNNETKDISLTEGYFLDFCTTDNGNYAVVTCNNDLLDTGVNHVVTELFDKEGNRLWIRELDVHVKYMLTFVAKIKAHSYPTEDGNKSDIVVTFEAEAFTIDEKTGQLVSSFTLPGDATMLLLNSANSFGRVGYRQGGIDFVDFNEGRIYSEYNFDTNDTVRDAVILPDMIIFDSYSSPDAHILTWHEAPDLEEYVTYDERMMPYAVSEDSKYYALRPTDIYTTLIFNNMDGEKLYVFDKAEFIENTWLLKDKAYVQDRNGIWEIDPYNKSERKISLEDYGFDHYSYSAYLTPDGRMGVFWALKELNVVDLAEGKSIYSGTTDKIIGKAILSDDGKTLYISEGSDNLYALDIASDKRREFADDKLITVANSYDKDFIALSPDNKYLALCCKDGYVRVADTHSMEKYAEIPLQSYLTAFVDFTDDGRHIVMQGDDYKVRIWDMDTKSFINTMDIYATVDYIVCDEDSDLMAVCTGYGLLLYETGSYGCVAYADEGLFYLKDNNSILLSRNRMEIKRTYYKDYKKLMEEARKQFPGATLNDEKKAKYNIN